MGERPLARLAKTNLAGKTISGFGQLIAGSGVSLFVSAWRLDLWQGCGEIALPRMRFDVTFQFRKYPHILLTEQGYDQGRRTFQ
jgi:hypothetical protein